MTSEHLHAVETDASVIDVEESGDETPEHVREFMADPLRMIQLWGVWYAIESYANESITDYEGRRQEAVDFFAHLKLAQEVAHE